MTSEPSEVAAVRTLLEELVPEIRCGAVRVRAIAREHGVRTKVAVEPVADGLDAVSACLGADQTRLRQIAGRLGGERVDVLRWHDEQPVLITNALRPARPRQMHLDTAGRRAVVLLDEGDPLLAAPDRPMRVRLAEQITGWRISLEPNAGDELGGSPRE